MGRKTFESIGHPLPNRINIIVTRDKNFKAQGCVIVHSVEEAIERAKNFPMGVNEVFIIGGGQIYKQAITYADKLYLTIVHKVFSGDTKFPEYKEFNKITYQRDAEENGLRYTFKDIIK